MFWGIDFKFGLYTQKLHNVSLECGPCDLLSVLAKAQLTNKAFADAGKWAY